MERRTLSTARNKSYSLYCVNFHGSGLKPIKEKFIAQIKTGLRRTVYLIDLNDIQEDYCRKNDIPQCKYDSIIIPESYLMPSIQKAIKKCWQEYEDVLKRLEAEAKFNLYEYFLKSVKDKSKPATGRRSSRKSKPGTPVTATSRTDKKKSLDPNEQPIVCVQTKVQEHNRVGQPPRLSLKKFILDDPTFNKLYIIVMGKMNASFYLNLMRHHLPIQGIIHFVPIESKYDQLLGNNKTHNFIMETLQKIGCEIYEERQRPILKPVGIFTHDIPMLSTCRAEWYATEIFDQLSWSIYDIEILHQQYQRFYVTPFQEVDVSMPSKISMQDLYKVVASMIVQGRYQTTEPPASMSDTATIFFYMDSLLSASTYPHNVLTETDLYGMATLGISAHTSFVSTSNFQLFWDIEDAFNSVTKFNKKSRLFVEEANKILTSLWLYEDQNMFRHIYRSCIDYHSLRPYILNDNLLRNVKCLPFSAEVMIFPAIVKLYLTDDSCCQRLTQLLEEYDDYFLEDLGNNNRLYTFRRSLNTIIESQGIYVLPSCLCFRDFTLFQMEEFLKDLVTPKMLDDRRKTKDELLEMKVRSSELNSSIYIRPNSLKGLMLTDKKGKKDKRDRKMSRVSHSLTQERSQSLRNNSARYSEFCPSLEMKSISSHFSTELKSIHSISVQESDDKEPVGLPPDHHLLKGYNLEDIRQEIRVKTTKYYFPQGYLHFYEDFWCFTELNKNLLFYVNRIKIYMQRPKEYVSHLGIAPNIRLQTKDNINLRILNEPQQCSRFIMQYPNGLTVHYHDTYAEQLWLQESSPQNEQKRLMTPYGCVIVFYKTQDIILIMRYNGEVYALHQYEFAVAEEEEGEETEQGTDVKLEENQQKSVGSLVKSSKRSSKFKKKEDENEKSKSSTTDQDEMLLEKKLDKKREMQEKLKMAITNEMEFLEKVLKQYNLSYVHLILTKANGRVIHFTSYGKIYEDRRLQFVEWHDYFLDEAYVERSDGVKMIWSPEGLKCYHKDGTLIVTKMLERFVKVEVEKIGSSITKSSSHANVDEEGYQKLPLLTSYLMTEPIEEHEAEKPFVIGEEEVIHTYSWLMHHKSYASVYIYWPKDAKNHYMEIYGAGDIRLFIEKYTNSMSEDVSAIEDEEATGEGSEEVDIIANVWIGNDLRLSVKECTMIIEPRMDCYYKVPKEQGNTIGTEEGGGEQEDEVELNVNDEEGIEEEMSLDDEEVEKEDKEKEEPVALKSEFVSLRIDLMNDITAIFRYLMDRIAETQANYKGAKTEELYFLQRILPDCQSKGFEFMEKFPTSGTYKTFGTNYVMTVEKFRNIHGALKHKSPMQKRDLAKFPKFSTKQKNSNERKKFPGILSTSIYCKIPEYLRNNERIDKFVESVEYVDFKKLRDIMKNLLDQELRPEITQMVRKLWTTNNWRIKRLNHDKLLFRRQQRLGLYMAMLKHKLYPKYFNFVQDYHCKVKNIDFFKFTLSQCRDKEVPREEVFLPKCDRRKSKRKHKPSNTSVRAQKKCK